MKKNLGMRELLCCPVAGTCISANFIVYVYLFSILVSIMMVYLYLRTQTITWSLILFLLLIISIVILSSSLKYYATKEEQPTSQAPCIFCGHYIPIESHYCPICGKEFNTKNP